jgi:hypothetical protein
MSKPRFADRIKKPNGDWVPSGSTDISVTFDKVRQRLEAQKQIEKLKREERSLRVIAITRKA